MNSLNLGILSLSILHLQLCLGAIVNSVDSRQVNPMKIWIIGLRVHICTNVATRLKFNNLPAKYSLLHTSVCPVLVSYFLRTSNLGWRVIHRFSPLLQILYNSAAIFTCWWWRRAISFKRVSVCCWTSNRNEIVQEDAYADKVRVTEKLCRLGV